MLVKYFKNVKPYPFLIGGIIVIILFQVITYFILHALAIEITFFQTYKSFFEGQSLLYAIPLICIIRPAFETLLFQVIPIDYIRKTASTYSEIIAIIISTTLFAAVHIGNGSFYPVMVLPGGVVLAVTYLKFNDNFRGFLFTGIQHGVYNLGLLIFLKV